MLGLSVPKGREENWTMSESRRFQALVPASYAPGIGKTSCQHPSLETFLLNPEHIFRFKLLADA